MSGLLLCIQSHKQTILCVALSSFTCVREAFVLVVYLEKVCMFFLVICRSIYSSALYDAVATCVLARASSLIERICILFMCSTLVLAATLCGAVSTLISPIGLTR